MTIKLSILNELVECQSCKAIPGERFCDLSLVKVGTVQFPICHDCALILAKELIDRYYALWGLILVHAETQPGILATILLEVRALRSSLGETDSDQDLPPDIQDALAGLGRG